MKKILQIFLLILIHHPSFAQVKWSADTLDPEKPEWNNYSTSYIGDNADSIPFIETAIPYNGMETNFEDLNTPLDLSFNGSLFRFRSDLNVKGRYLATYDSTEVYFLTPGIYPNNANLFEYRILLNSNTVIKPWSKVNKFTNIAIGNFKKGYGFLGGYKTLWGNYIVVELRRKGSDTSFSNAVVYWREIKPSIQSIFTSKDFNELFKIMKRPWDRTIKPVSIPAHLILEPSENNIIFTLALDIYKKEALEYSLIKDGKVFIDWKPNDFDNNLIWLKNLTYGAYTIQIRYAKQRHMVTAYSFDIKPFWYQTILFKIITTLLVTGSIGFVFLLIRLSKQKKKLLAEKQKKEITENKLKAIRSQLNPHFVFNSLSSIQGLINKNEIDNANKYLSDFASLMRDTLNGNENQNNSHAQEIKLLENYLRLEQLRFHFQYKITAEKSINESSLEIPSLLLQPLVENAVKHGISNLQKNGRILINFSQVDKNITCTISDNGKGFDPNKITNGFGLRLTRERIALINENLKYQSIRMEIETVHGTSVHLIFENWLS